MYPRDPDPLLQRVARNGLVGDPALDRCGPLRSDARWWQEQMLDRRSRYLAVVGSRHLVAAGEQPRSRPLEDAEREVLAGRAESCVFLGEDASGPIFALGFAESDPQLDQTLERQGALRGLRGVAPLLPAGEAAVLAYAQAMVHWHRRQRFCGTCGAPTVSAAAGHQRDCSRPECGTPHFPRTDPAVIVLVCDAERCLLGRQAGWPPGMYSTLAGFVEPGEALEQAVCREVYEEAGVQIADLEYHSSQPWPFPASLMVGFLARPRDYRVTCRDGELADAGWWTRRELRNAIVGGELRLPSALSISFRLLENWFDRGGEGPLAALHGPEPAARPGAG